MSSEHAPQAPTGELYVIAAPSGAGKTSLILSLLDTFPKLSFSVSATTRPPRANPIDRQQYQFLSREAFEERIAQGGFLEYAEVFGNYYGTERAQVEGLWAEGRDVLLEIDVQGAAQIRRSHPDACQIFILPPSLETLAARLTARGQDQPEVIARRLAEAQAELARCLEFDWLVVNDDFDQARAELAAIFKAWPLRRRRQAVSHRQRIEQMLAPEASRSILNG